MPKFFGRVDLFISRVFPWEPLGNSEVSETLISVAVVSFTEQGNFKALRTVIVNWHIAHSLSPIAYY